jgi:hypothetical protein
MHELYEWFDFETLNYEKEWSSTTYEWTHGTGGATDYDVW